MKLNPCCPRCACYMAQGSVLLFAHWRAKAQQQNRIVREEADEKSKSSGIGYKWDPLGRSSQACDVKCDYPALDLRGVHRRPTLALVRLLP